VERVLQEGHSYLKAELEEAVKRDDHEQIILVEIFTLEWTEHELFQGDSILPFSHLVTDQAMKSGGRPAGSIRAPEMLLHVPKPTCRRDIESRRNAYLQTESKQSKADQRGEVYCIPAEQQLREADSQRHYD
jgi:hypothetical protein